MTFTIDAYTPTGHVTGVVARAEPLREVLEAGGELLLEGCRMIDVEGRESSPAALRLPVDDLILVLEADTDRPIHANWHALRLNVGPFVVDGELPTLPGFDPGRALARPTGDFVLLREATIHLRDEPDVGAARYSQLLVNRYAVEVVEADIELGFFFPGARVVPRPHGSGIAGN
jgi:hypothetical protein